MAGAPSPRSSRQQTVLLLMQRRFHTYVDHPLLLPIEPVRTRRPLAKPYRTNLKISDGLHRSNLHVAKSVPFP